MWKILLVAGLLLGIPGLTYAQTCLQADTSHPAQATLTWQDNSTNETGFVLERQLNGGSFTALAPIAANITQVVDTTVVRDPVITNTYTYRLKAVIVPTSGATLSSTYSNLACIAFLPPPPPAPPAAPSGLTTAALSQSSIQASWSDNSDNEDQFRIDLTGFSPPRNFSRVAPANTTSLIIGGLTKNKTYCSTMVSLNIGGVSAPTNQSCTTTMR